MEENTKGVARGSVGSGSSYRKGTQHDLKERSEIGAVLGGQIWVIKPDKDAKASNPCLWMQAGVVEFKNCNNFYDCTTCKYDEGMQKQAEKGKHLSWQDAMRRKPSLERHCRHTLTRRIERRACAYNYECSTCDFDQFFEEVWAAKVGSQPYDMRSIKGFQVPAGAYFHDGHTWARIESGGLIRVGMDDFSSKPGVANMYGLIQGEPNAIAPRERPLSSMSPTIIHPGPPSLTAGEGRGEGEERVGFSDEIRPQTRPELESPEIFPSSGKSRNPVFQDILDPGLRRRDEPPSHRHFRFWISFSFPITTRISLSFTTNSPPGIMLI